MRARAVDRVAVACAVGVLVTAGAVVGAGDDGSVEVERLAAGAADQVPVEDDATLVVDLLDSEPEAWGGVHVDGDVLVVTSVSRAPEDALAVLADAGVAGSVRVRPGRLSLAELRAAADRLADDPAVWEVATGIGPDQRTGTVVVHLRSWPTQPWSLSPVPAQVDGVPVRVEYGGGVPSVVS